MNSTLNDEIKKIRKSDEMGSTATIIFITKETNQLLGSKKIIYCANIGDTIVNYLVKIIVRD